MSTADANGQEPTGAVAGIKVLDVATIFAGPLAAGTLLADFGADVIKIEHPRGDPLRHHGPVKDGHGLWWKSASRNKRCITLNLSTDRGQELFRELVREADVVIENFRPGVMERWSLGYDELARENPGLSHVRVTGFGQFGPYSGRAGFGTLAEAIERLRTDHRRGRRPADAAALRSCGRHRRVDRCLRRHVRALQTATRTVDQGSTSTSRSSSRS